MRHIAAVLFAVFVVLLLSLNASAQTYNETVNIVETETSITYYGFMDTLETDTRYTQDFLVSPFAKQNQIWVIGIATDEAGTEDVDVWIECSNDRLQWYTESTQILTQVGTTASADSVESLLPLAAQWCRVKVIGQTGNPAASDFYWSIQALKPSATENNVARVVNRRTA